MSKDFYIGVDLGTSAVKAGVVSADGRVLAVASRESVLDTSKPGHVELDADDYTTLAFECIREAIETSAVPGRSVRALGLSSQGQTFALLDEDDRPVRPAVSWLDVRAAKEAEELSEESTRIGHRKINAVESAPKILWLRRHEAEVAARVRRVLLIPDYLIFRLTGASVSDPVTAGSTGVYDRRAEKWLEPLLEMCGLRPEMMPTVLFPGETGGSLTREAARQLGLSEETIVALGSNDQSVGALGAGNVTHGCASITLGTALAIIVSSRTGAGVPEGVSVGLHPARGLYTILAYAKTAGIVLKWFRDTFAPSLSYEALFEEIASVPIGSAGVSCLPHFSGTATPEFNLDARGAFSGLALSHRRPHLARAIVESLTFTIRENLDILRPVVGGIKELRAIGGGAKSDVWLQMIADATGVVVERPATREAATLGAAELAMVAAGRFDSVAHASLALYRGEKRFEPDSTLRSQYDEAFKRCKTLYQSLYA